jgi:hypothetical protein
VITFVDIARAVGGRQGFASFASTPEVAPLLDALFKSFGL